MCCRPRGRISYYRLLIAHVKASPNDEMMTKSQCFFHVESENRNLANPVDLRSTESENRNLMNFAYLRFVKLRFSDSSSSHVTGTTWENFGFLSPGF